MEHARRLDPGEDTSAASWRRPACPPICAAVRVRSVNAVARAYVEELAARPDVEAVILFGSQARGDSRPDSDVDLLVLVAEGYRRAWDERDGQAFELLFLSADVARDYLGQNLDTAAEFWASAQILFEHDGRASRLRDQVQEMLAAGKPALDEGTLTSSRFNAEDQLRAAEGLALHDAATASAVLHNKVLELTGSYFDVRQRWTPSLKRRVAEIANTDPELHALLTAFYAVRFAEQLELARKMVPLVYET